MRLAILGCGYVADYYLSTLSNHPELALAGVYDRDPARARRSAVYGQGARVYSNLDELLADPEVELVLNLTNPASHYELNRACLEAGKHVYTEKPLALDFAEAQALVELAEARGLQLASAPCTLLGEAAQTVWKLLRENAVGNVRLAYCELDEGMIHRMGFRRWRSPSGLHWPWQDEFAVGCTVEHAGYGLTWLTAFFGPARRITGAAALAVPDKQTDAPVKMAPDFSVGVIEFDHGVTARITCGVVAEHDHRLRIFGDDGVLTCHNLWYFDSAVHLERRDINRNWIGRVRGLRRLRRLASRRRSLVRPARFASYSRVTHWIDFSRGPAELAAAVREKRPSRMSARHALHVTELTLAMQDPARMGSPRTLVSSFEPIAPMPWAQ